jgi:D-arginine dehydrogenase
MLEAEQHCGYHATGRSAAFWLESYGGPKVAMLTGASRQFLDSPGQEFASSGFLRTRGALHLTRNESLDIGDGVYVRPVGRAELERMVPGIRPGWTQALLEPGCADIDVAALHGAYLRAFRRRGGEISTGARLQNATYDRGRWTVTTEQRASLSASVLVDAAGAWADAVAIACGVEPIGIAPKRRTMVQLRVGQSGLKDLPLIDDAAGTFYFKGEGDRSIWLSPHDEIACEPCDAAPEEIDVATAIDRFQQVVEWPVERVERSWAGLRSFAPDRLPVYGFDRHVPSFFWCAGQGGFGIQSAPAASKLAAAVLLDEAPHESVAGIAPALFSPARFS